MTQKKKLGFNLKKSVNENSPHVQGVLLVCGKWCPCAALQFWDLTSSEFLKKILRL